MPIFAACKKYSGRVTGLTIAKDAISAGERLNGGARTKVLEYHEIKELPDRPAGWDIWQATDYFFPEYD